MEERNLQLVFTNSGDAYLGSLVGNEVKHAISISIEDGEDINASSIRSYVSRDHMLETQVIDLVNAQYHSRQISPELQDYYSYCLTVLEQAVKTAIRKVEKDRFESMVR